MPQDVGRSNFCVIYVFNTDVTNFISIVSEKAVVFFLSFIRIGFYSLLAIILIIPKITRCLIDLPTTDRRLMIPSAKNFCAGDCAILLRVFTRKIN